MVPLRYATTMHIRCTIAATSRARILTSTRRTRARQSDLCVCRARASSSAGTTRAQAAVQRAQSGPWTRGGQRS